MSLDLEIFEEWCRNRFNDDIVVSGDQILVNSIFTDDQKHHLSCNPTKFDYGAYRCFKTDNTGSCVGLVMQVDGCDFETALETLGGDTTLQTLMSRFNALFDPKIEIEPEISPVLTGEIKLEFPPCTYPISSLKADDPFRISAESYLAERHLHVGNKLVCVAGKYWNRLIIPYYDRSGKLVYWNARTLGDATPKYRGPSQVEYLIGKGDVVYMPKWLPAGSDLLLTEGELDVESLIISEINGGGIGGKWLSPKQFELIKDYNLIFGLDTDKAGLESYIKMSDWLLEDYKLKTIRVVRPSKQFKDWNDMMIKTSPAVVHAYVKQYTKTYSIYDFKFRTRL